MDAADAASAVVAVADNIANFSRHRACRVAKQAGMLPQLHVMTRGVHITHF